MAIAASAPSVDAREAMERLNAEAAPLNIWLRTQANAPAQRPWFRETGLAASGRIAGGRVGAAQLKPVAHHWRWREITPYLDRIAEIARNADVSPIEFAERQQFSLTNPGLGGRLQVTSTMRCAVSIYNPGDVAPVHIHTPNASRTILSDSGGYTSIEGERCEAARGDLILTPNGTWHDHGNDGAEPVVWIDVLDFPLMEFLDCVWLDEEFHGETAGNTRAQAVTDDRGYSRRLYGKGGLVPGFASHRRGFGRDTSPMFHYRGADVRAVLDGLRSEAGDPYEGDHLAFREPGDRGIGISDLGLSRDPCSATARKPGSSAKPLARSIRSSRAVAPPRSPAAGSNGRRTTFLSCRVSLGVAMSTVAKATRSSMPCRTCRYSKKSANTVPKAGCLTTPLSNSPAERPVVWRGDRIGSARAAGGRLRVSSTSSNIVMGMPSWVSSMGKSL